ncbi:MAG: site-specific integrase [Actinomycetota bacterium]|jgi:integrase|nr:site-specific integrase [Actinomycetota bacterium]
MTTPAGAAAWRPAVETVDWRIERLVSLMGDDWLAGEWDPDLQLIMPRPGGPLHRVAACVVAGCPSDGHWSSSLCVRHRTQFAESGSGSVESWLASGMPAVFTRRRGTDQVCAVKAREGPGCPRPALGRFGLCQTHSVGWWKRRSKGDSFEEFLADALPLSALGECAAACCYRPAAHPDAGLCVPHAQIWRAEGRPRGAAFSHWAARVRQPVNSRVLSLRGLPELVRLELVYAIGARAAEQVSVVTGGMRPWIDQLRASGVASVTEFYLAQLEGIGDRSHVRFARFSVDRVSLAYADPEAERAKDVWDLRLFGVAGRRRLDFTGIRQGWLRDAAKAWAAATIGRVGDGALAHRVGSVSVLSAVLASGPGGGEDPATLGRSDIERFLTRVASRSFPAGRPPWGPKAKAALIEECALMLREARELGLLADLGPIFAFRRGDRSPRLTEEPPGRALPAGVVAQLDANLELLAAVPGAAGAARVPTLGVLGEHAGEMAVLVYGLLKGTGRRVGEVASLHLECLDVDEHGKDVLVYDNHKAARMVRRLPLADSALVAAVRAQQAWVRSRFPATAPERLWLLPRPHKNADGANHIDTGLVNAWFRSWMTVIPRIDAGPLDHDGSPVGFDRSAIQPHALRHTYAQTMADQGVAPSVLRDLMDHRSLSTTLGYYRVGDARKRAAMELLARHTINNRGLTRPVGAASSRAGHLREHLSWVAVPMGKCSEPTNVRAGGGACPIRYQCAGCAHFESDPSYLPELRAYADQLRKEREAMLAAGATDWAADHLSRQLEVIVGHVRVHEATLADLAAQERAVIEDASATLRKVRQSVPVAFGRRRASDG